MVEMTPLQLADLAEEMQKRGNIGVAYTYNEPLVGHEFVRDCAAIVHARGMKNVVVTNGSVQLEILETLLPDIDAMNIDLKALRQRIIKGWAETCIPCRNSSHVRPDPPMWK